MICTSRIRALGGALAVMLTLSVRADPPDEAAPDASRPERLDRPIFYAVPAPFFLPETSIGLALVGGLHLSLCPNCGRSSLELQTAYTARKQLVIEARGELFLSDRLALSARVKYGLFPDRFYGLGPDTSGSGEPYTPRTIQVELAPGVTLGAPWLRAGPAFHLYRQEIVAREAAGLLATGGVCGAGEVTALGAGATVAWDGRDSRFFPTQGTYASARYLFYPGPAGGQGAFGLGFADLRHYLLLGAQQVLALQIHGEASHGKPPFALLPALGGDTLLRGYAAGRYRDALLWAAQGEYRFPIVGRFGGAAFAGLGSVAPSPSRFGLRTVRVAGGLGARFRVSEDGVRARLDVATSGDDLLLYVMVLEAF